MLKDVNNLAAQRFDVFNVFDCYLMIQFSLIFRTLSPQKFQGVF